MDETAQRIKLTDFGSAEIIGEKRINYSKTFSADPNAGTLSYNPPEVRMYMYVCSTYVEVLIIEPW